MKSLVKMNVYLITQFRCAGIPLFLLIFKRICICLFVGDIVTYSNLERLKFFEQIDISPWHSVAHGCSRNEALFIHGEMEGKEPS